MTPIKLPGGSTVTPFKPPSKDFSMLRASDSELLLYGFPPRPQDPRLRQRYDAWATRLSRKLQWTEPDVAIIEGKGHGTRLGPRRSTTSNSENWSGVQVQAAAGDSISWVTGSWVVPNVSHPTTSQNYYSCHWVGIDGNNSTQPLFQAGVECDVSSGDSRDFYAWYEWLPNDATQIEIKNMPVNAGDYVTVIVCSDSGAGSTTGTIYFTNSTLGVYTSFRVSAPDSALLGGTAEWISESTEVNGVIESSMLADYGEIFFSDALAGSVGHVFLDGFSGNEIEMKDSVSGVEYSIGVPIATELVRTVYMGPAATK